MLRRLKWSSVFAVVAVGACSRPAPQTGFAGTWVMALGARPFIVMTLRSDNGTFTGRFVVPDSMQTGDGISFTKISGPAVEQPVTHGTVDGAALRFTVENPKDKTDTDDFEMTLAGDDRALVKWVGFPIPMSPLSFRRIQGAEAPAVATDWDPLRTYSAELPEAQPSKEMDAIYNADQEVRQNPTNISAEQWKEIEKTDGERRRQTRALLDKGALQTGDDFRKAAFVFQHGEEPNDFLLAHTLALVALAKGDISAAWIATATLDRYLSSIKQPQIYGTQFSNDNKQTLFDRDLVSDALRRSLHVPALAEQQDQMKLLDQLPSTPVK